MWYPPPIFKLSICFLVSQGEKGQVTVDGCGSPCASAEGAWLANYAFDDLKEKKQPRLDISEYGLEGHPLEQWNKGKTLAESQNVARW